MRKHFTELLIVCSAVILYCAFNFFVYSKFEQQCAHAIHPKRNVLRTHIANGMLVVDNYTQVIGDEKEKVEFPLSFIDERFTPDVNDSIERAKMRSERLKSPRRFCVDFIGTVDGYHVSAVFHPDEDDDFYGMASFHFKSSKNDFTIETAYNWWNWYLAFNGSTEILKFNGEKGTVKIDPKALQGQGSEIENPDCSPFILKDVDFDGEKEILFRYGRRHRDFSYWIVYKVVGKNEAAYMCNRPYSRPLDISTEFDYDNKTILNTEGGFDFYVEAKYVRKDVVHDKLSPMDELYYRHIKEINAYENEPLRVANKRHLNQVTIEAVYNLHKGRLYLDNVFLYNKNGTKAYSLRLVRKEEKKQ